MAIKKVQIIPPNYTDIIHPETQADITKYNNSNSELVATNVQSAIDEIDTKTEENKTDILSAKTTLGSVAMTTTSQTVTGAINELDGDIGDKSTLITTNKTNLVNAVNENREQINKLAAYAVASGTNTYIATINGITALNEGLAVKIKFTNANTLASTLNINGLGAKSILKGNGGALVNGNIKAGQICHLVYNGSNFQLLGEGGEYGTATALDVLSGKTIGTDNGIVEGIMQNRGTVNQALTQQGQQYTIPGGKHSGSGKVAANFANLTAGNVKNGVNIGGVVGSYNNEGFNLLPANFGSNALSWDTKFGRVINHYLSSGTIPYNNSKIFNDLIIFTPQNQNAKYTIEAIDKDIIIDNSIINSIPFVLSAGSTQNIENITSTTIFNFKGGTVRLTDINDNSVDINYYVILSKPN